jgi:hypothetical protein
MHEDLSFEDIKRQFLQRPLIPESTRRYAQEVIAFFEQGLISRELAAKYLGDIARDLEKIQAHMASLDKIETIQVGEATEVSAVDYEKLKRHQEERAKMTEAQWKQEMYGTWIE